MIKALLVSLTLLSTFSPVLPHWFNFSFTESQKRTICESEHTAKCVHQHTIASKEKIAFGTEMGKVIKENRIDYKIRTVVLDAGHGGKDPGCSGASSSEKHIALAVARELKNQLRTAYPDLNIIMTREEDEFIPLNERANIANRSNADLFISIHCNYIPRYYGTKGTETYVLGLHRAEDNLNVAKRENAAILYEDNYEKTYDGFDPDSDEGHIILSMYQNAFLQQSILFASLVEHQFQAAENRKSRGVKQAGFLVLRETTMPSVLVETGFLSNRAEEQFLKSKMGQQEVANSIFDAFRLYKNAVEEGNGSGMPNTAFANLQTAAPTTTHHSSTSGNSSSSPIQLPTRVESTPQEIRKTETTYYDVSKTVRPDDLDTEQKEDVLTGLENYDAFQTGKIIATPTNYSKKNTEPSTLPEPNQPQTSRYQNNKTTKVNTSPSAEMRSNVPIYYRVQLAASKTKVDTREARWTDIPYIVEVVWENDLNKYQIRNIESFEEADRIRIEMLHKGFMGAFIVAYQNGERLSNKELGEMN